MKKSILITSISLFLAVNSLQAAEPSKGTHLVDDHIKELRSQLNTTTLNYAERRKLESYLRRYFDNELYGQHQTLKPLENAETKRVASSIIKSYQDILKTPGTHKEAATHFALQAGGLIAYYTKPAKQAKTKGKVAPSRATEKTGTQKVGTSETKPKGWLEEAESYVLGKGSEKPAETKPAVAQPAAKTTAKPVVKPVEKTQMASEKSAKEKKEAGKKHKKTEKEKKEKRAKKQAKKAKKHKKPHEVEAASK